jgi:hypothetical protein
MTCHGRVDSARGMHRERLRQHSGQTDPRATGQHNRFVEVRGSAQLNDGQLPPPLDVAHREGEVVGSSASSPHRPISPKIPPLHRTAPADEFPPTVGLGLDSS